MALNTNITITMAMAKSNDCVFRMSDVSVKNPKARKNRERIKKVASVVRSLNLRTSVSRMAGLKRVIFPYRISFLKFPINSPNSKMNIRAGRWYISDNEYISIIIKIIGMNFI